MDECKPLPVAKSTPLPTSPTASGINSARCGSAVPTADRRVVERSSASAVHTRHPTGRGLHSSTLQLNLSAFSVTGGAVRGWFGGVLGVVKGVMGV